jgi:hypothetical protein
VYLMTWKPTFETDEGNQREWCRLSTGAGGGT